MNILVVDDSKLIRHMVTSVLSDLGYPLVTEASDVAEAKKILKQEKINLIISDWHMPGESGLDFLKFVKSTPQYAHLPFIIQTTENEKKNIVEAVKAGVAGYLFKPVQKNAIAQKLTELAKLYPIQAPKTATTAGKSSISTGAAQEATAGIYLTVPAEGALSAKCAGPLSKQESCSSFIVNPEGADRITVCMGLDKAGRFVEFFRKKFPEAHCVFLTDSSVQKRFAKEAVLIEQELGCVTIQAPEKNENGPMALVDSIVNTLISKQIDSASVMIAFGELPLVNIAGFVAAVYRGGMRLVIIALSLQDFLNCSAGTKFTLDAQNVCGALSLRSAPAMVWFDIAEFSTVPETEYPYLCAELFRHAFFGGKECIEAIKKLWDHILKRDIDAIATSLRLCIAARGVVHSLKADPSITDAVLDFGKPVSKAIVALSAQTGLHPGQATYRAIACICEVAKRIGAPSADSFADYVEGLKMIPVFQLPTPLDRSALLKKVMEFTPLYAGQKIIALPGITGNMTVRDFQQEAFLETFKVILSPSSDKNL
jgi:two-component system, chemotaxis family, chemotaxis protein CheY